MKINSLVAKTALAAAIAGASFAASAGDLKITTKPSVVAVELFTGDAASDQTSITLPSITFKPAASFITTAAAGDTIKLTLADTHAVFATSYNDPASWAAQGVVISVNGTPLDESSATVEAAGNQGDNVIIVKVKNATGVDGEVVISGLSVWNLRNTHNNLDGTTEVNVEISSEDGLKSDSDENLTVIYTAQGVKIAGKATNYNDGDRANRGYIEVDSAQTLFTDAVKAGQWFNIDNATNNAHRDVFKADEATNILYFGEFSLARGSVNGNPAGNEQGANFQISGGDKVSIKLSADGADLTDYNLGIYKDDGATPCVGTLMAKADSAGNISSAGIALGAKYELCAVVPTKGAPKALPTLSKLQANIAVDYTNVRYGNSSGTFDYGSVYRNGCSVTLFNLPHPSATDSAMIRFTNTSAGTQSGEVTVTVWGEDGKELDQSVSVLDNLDTHATAILHTNSKLANTENRVYLGDALPEFADSTGRSRIVIDGAFPSCEALGMVRSANGTLVNMTSTVYSGSENNTSNTSN